MTGGGQPIEVGHGICFKQIEVADKPNDIGRSRLARSFGNRSRKGHTGWPWPDNSDARL